MVMKKVIRILIISVLCALPTLVQAQATRKIQGMVTLSDDAIIDAVIGGPFNCYVYSFYNKEDADRIRLRPVVFLLRIIRMPSVCNFLI